LAARTASRYPPAISLRQNKAVNVAMSQPDIHNLAFVEELYAGYVRDPQSVPAEWREYFRNVLDGAPAPAAFRTGPSFQPASLFNPPSDRAPVQAATGDAHRIASLQDKVNQLIRNFRVRAHVCAAIDPLGLPRPVPPDLDPATVGLTEADMDCEVSCENFVFEGSLTVRQLIERLRHTYCRSIGVQYMHIDEVSVRRWLQQRMESTENRLQLAREHQLRILTRLTDATMFEEFIRKKFIGAKSFSLEGCESLIPLLDLAIEEAGEQGVKEIVLGMAHRGRLNVLANIMGKSPRDIFREFEDKDAAEYEGRGDVKYHLGHSNDWFTAGGKRVHLSLCFNPSHLEFANPVVLGRTRAKQDRVDDRHQELCMALLIHGDAAFAGQGIVQETLNLSQLPGYSVGGTLHVIVNNQIGFTSSPIEARSTNYATDVAKMLQIPIFHVNGEDPEAVAQCVRVAMDFRHTFKRDVVIDMHGYRRFGHNETDEPSFTQPVLYRAIERRKSVREGYLDHLLQLGGVTREEADEIDRQRHERLEQALSEARSGTYKKSAEYAVGIWRRSQFTGGPEKNVPDVDTGVPRKKLSGLLRAKTDLPDYVKVHPKLVKLLEQRRLMAEGRQPLDWAAAEALAFGTLAVEGHRVRLSGQDCRRGTFSHRHAALFDYEDGLAYIPLQNLSKDQAPVEIFNSPLSEPGVLGFEYGYSLDCPDGLVLWEAQFGDFVNVAQVIIDQFIASAEDKWRRLSGLVLLLPHGFEGMGPEHSSARLERFLVLAAEDNLQIIQPTTPSQYFHALRRQLIRPWRKPLVVMSPKSLLRHPKVVSRLDDLAQGRFHRILPDEGQRDPQKVKRVLACSGKVYFELAARREELKRNNVAILRFEQLYPLPEEKLAAALEPYRKGTPVFWVQDEPENMGAWRYLRVRFGETLLDRHPLTRVSRPASASPATGSHNSHKVEQARLLEAAFA
jgi:2-oxoglutarate dehydrogenase E1 component